jgi:hypothetical protein
MPNNLPLRPLLAELEPLMNAIILVPLYLAIGMSRIGCTVQLRRTLLTMALITSFASSGTPGTNAATISLGLVLNPAVPGCTGCILSGPGTYDLYASDSLGDNFGIASYGISIQNVSSMIHRSPQVLLVDDGNGNTDPAGFTLLSSANNQTPTGTGFYFGASQDTITPTQYLIRGFGQMPGSFPIVLPLGVQLSGVLQQNWGAPLLIAEGSFDTHGPAPKFDFNNTNVFVNVFSSAQGIRVIQAKVVPEPSNVVLVCVAFLGAAPFITIRRKLPQLTTD